MAYVRKITGPDIALPFRLIRGAVAIQGAASEAHSITLLPGCVWPGLPGLPEAVVQVWLPCESSAVSESVWDDRVDARDLPLAAAFVEAMLLRVGQHSEREARLARHVNTHGINGATLGAMLGARRESVISTRFRRGRPE